MRGIDRLIAARVVYEDAEREVGETASVLRSVLVNHPCRFTHGFAYLAHDLACTRRDEAVRVLWRTMDELGGGR